MFVLEKSGLSLDAEKIKDGALVPVPICFVCSRGKSQARLHQAGEEGNEYFLCTGCKESKADLPEGDPPQVLVRPFDNADHSAWRQEKLKEKAKSQAATSAAEKEASGNHRGQGFQELFAKELGALTGLGFMGPKLSEEEDAEGIARFVLVGWRGFSHSVKSTVKPLKYSYRAALKYMKSPATADFRTFVVAASRQRSNFDALQEAADSKNSERPSSST